MLEGYGRAAGPGLLIAPPLRQPAPPGVQALAILHYVSAAAMAVCAAAMLLLPADVIADVGYASGGEVPLVLRFSAGALVVGALFNALVGQQLQRGRQWARILTLVLSAFTMVGVLLLLVQTGDPAGLASLVWPALSAALLNTRAARSWFTTRAW
ncbi:hypothetical protein J2S43_004298 [Catenuloplanes nepalensis]|uniref:DUF2306 domain-containing protein n=1 Tax=Catenuloplanes nepalensis TaxID=587533 RepID=A0ABT9MXN2_9ACTN|nr:hypothetical protein [Catenuloplanes nepalensis]MDP9795786.1 hypothetical protein [Catenuloplanes nepalensis]